MRTRPILSSSDPVAADTGAEENRLPVRGHRSVLLHEAIEFLDIQSSDTIIDATLGGAGHAQAIVAKLGKKGSFIGFDLDHDALERAAEALKKASCKVDLIGANFRTLQKSLAERSVFKIDKALFDLGWSSFQILDGRGFSFLSSDPLAMTYEKAPSKNALTAARIINTWSESSIADVIFGWGEDRFSRRIARAIVERREKKPFVTANDLAEVVLHAVPRGKGKIHPATKTFQALRIAVNDELGALKEGLAAAWSILSPGGRIAVISFHSIEDRIVKQFFAGLEKNREGKRLTKKPMTPSPEEVRANPRSRSAKLRVVTKTHEQNQNTFS